ncbi:MAG TPA: bifunctional DNA primase/polymerase [Trebonia sp.]
MEDAQGPYARAAWAYRKLGWAGVLPLPPMRKGPPPSGYTGWAGVDPSGADVQAWVDGREGAGNIALHMPPGVYGLDVDAYGSKTGAAALERLVAELGPLPATWSVSSREDGVSGIRLFRAQLPTGRVWVDEPGGHGAGIESVHVGHRYAVVAPSVHPDTERLYQWRDGVHLGTVEAAPTINELAELPAAWVERLSRPGEIRSGTMAGHDETVQVVTSWRDGDQCTRVAAGYQRAVEALRAVRDGAALHPPANDALWELACLGNEGHRGARRALADHYGAWMPAAVEHGRDEREADAEWWRLVRGAVGKLDPSATRAACDCDLLGGEGVTFDPVADLGGVLPVAALPAAQLPTDEVEQQRRRRVDLGPWLDGSYVPPTPNRGALRDDTRQLLYSGKWHNVDAPSEAGKSMLAIAHARDEMLNAARTVVYIHFEEELPGGTVDRLVAIGLPPALIRERFVWLSNEWAWENGDLAAELAGIGDVGLVVLDGRNAACSRHGRDPALVETVGWFRHRFVSPATRLGAAVISLGHPPKARDRQDERHGYGSTAWLDEIDGVAFRMVSARGGPIRKGASGAAGIHVVKDRYGEVSKLCRPEERDGWRYAGSLIVDDSGASYDSTSMRLVRPSAEPDEPTRDEIDRLGDQIVEYLGGTESKTYESKTDLGNALRAAGVTHRNGDLEPALIRLEDAGRLERDPDGGSGRKRKGWLPSIYRDTDPTDPRPIPTDPGDRSETDPTDPRAYIGGDRGSVLNATN